ncbi:hypothetical protein ACHQM5_015342 [Ranunculus cassubicifolius]
MASGSGELSKEGQLLLACFSGNLRQVKVLVKTMDDGKDISEILVKIKERGGMGLLHAAAHSGKTNVCKYLLEEFKFDVNEKDPKDRTPLIHASIDGHSRTMTYLIEKGADPFAKCKDNLTALHYAAVNDVIPVLVSKGVDVNALSALGTPLCMAAQQKKRDTLKSLLDHGANPNLTDGVSATPLGLTLYVHSTECTALMLKAGADPNAVTCGKRPLGFAAAEGKLDFIKLLLEYKADPNLVGDIGLLPIEHAAANRKHKEVRALFPVTSPIPGCPDWSVKGVIKYVNSEAQLQQRKIMYKKRNLIARAKGDDALKRGEYGHANLYYTEAIAFDESDAIAHSKKSLCWACIGSIEMCLESAKVCMRLRPDWPEAYFRLGVAYRTLGDCGKAADVFLSGLKLDRGNKELQVAFWILLGLTYFLFHFKREAIEAKLESMHV